MNKFNPSKNVSPLNSRSGCICNNPIGIIIGFRLRYFKAEEFLTQIIVGLNGLTSSIFLVKFYFSFFTLTQIRLKQGLKISLLQFLAFSLLLIDAKKLRNVSKGKVAWFITQLCVYQNSIRIFVVERIRTLLENHRKSLIQHCERNEVRLYFEWTKVD